MTPSDYPLSIYRGDSYQWQFKLWLDAAKTQPLDLAGVIAKSEIRDKSGGTMIYPIQCDIVEPNIITASLSSGASAAIPLAPQVWDLQLTYVDGSVNTILAGTVTVIGDVTDSFIPPPEPPVLLAAPTPLQRIPRKVR